MTGETADQEITIVEQFRLTRVPMGRGASLEGDRPNDIEAGGKDEERRRQVASFK